MRTTLPFNDPRVDSRPIAVDRRAFLWAGATTAVALLPGSTEAGETAPADADTMGVLVDLGRCNGCRRCEAACRGANGFSIPTDEELKDKAVFEQIRRPVPTQQTVVNRFDHEEWDRPVFAKINCLHCVDAACVSACLVGALRKNADGAVTYDPNKCMGCRYCMVVCPFQMPTYEYDNAFTPQVRKCTLCAHKSTPETGALPACVTSCPKECLIYGRRSDLLQRAHDRIAQHPELYVQHVYGEREAGGTAWLYLSPVPFEQIGFPAVAPAPPPRLSETIQHGVFSHFVPPLALCVILALASWLTRAESDQEPAEARRRARRRTWPIVSGAGGDGHGRSVSSHAARVLNQSRFDRP